ncbi:MAG: signal recognition particle protein [Armatimonadota bacterium]
MFANLQNKLNEVFKKLRSRGKLTEKDVTEALREVRIALLEADVNLKVARDFINKVKEKAVGEAVWNSLTPGQLVIKYVKDEMVTLMGQVNEKINFASQGPTVIMIVGLHGGGKTTTTGKLANMLRKEGKSPLLVPADVYRPAAIKQLQVLGKQLDMPVFDSKENLTPLQICKQAIEQADKSANDVIIIDTAGRLHIDSELMNELIELKNTLSPQEVLLVVDSMTGQEAVKIAGEFDENLNITGVILTKLDGDSRGGAALSVKAVTGKPIKFIGIGEKLDAIEPFHPDRITSRVLGMGDVLSLIEKAESTFEVDHAKKLHEKLKKLDFDLEDFLEQLNQMKKMGPMDQILGMIPGFAQNKALKNVQVDENQMKRIEAIIQSMTKEERLNPNLLNASRKKRVAAGSGAEVSEINKLLKQFEMTKKMLKQVSSMGTKGLKLPFFG